MGGRRREPGDTESKHERIRAAVRQIPRGRVASYGQIARLVPGCTPRLVGFAMAGLPAGTDVPWQRVINGRGEVSERSGGDGACHQRELLEAEGVRFDARGRVDFAEYGWLPDLPGEPTARSRRAPARRRRSSA
jgi:methylated-DNA-protein-cysteine methyltransferase-like protein